MKPAAHVCAILMLLAAGACGSSSCTEKPWQRVASPNGKLEVLVSGRTCGSASGFVVTLGRPGHDSDPNNVATLLMARISAERDANSAEYADAVSAEWISDTQIVISYAAWIAAENTGPMEGPPGPPRYPDINVAFRVKPLMR
jgi:hypothetical protein